MIKIRPYEGITIGSVDVNFGMSQKEVKRILKEEAPRIEIDNIMEEIREMRWGMIFTYTKKQLLMGIRATLNVELYYEDIDIFNTEGVIDKLSLFDSPTPEAQNGYINFYGLGISMGGFGKRKIPEKKLVSIFPKDRVRFYEFFLKM